MGKYIKIASLPRSNEHLENLTARLGREPAEIAFRACVLMASACRLEQVLSRSEINADELLAFCREFLPQLSRELILIMKLSGVEQASAQALTSAIIQDSCEGYGDLGEGDRG